MAFGQWISNLVGIFEEGPMKDLTEEVARASKSKKAAEEVIITDEFRQTFNVDSPVRENVKNSFLFSMLLMASHIVLADGKVEPEEYEFLGRFLRINFGKEAEQEGMEVVKKIIAKRAEMEARKPMAFLQMIGDCGNQIAQSLSEDLRYQMLSMLALIVKSDDNVTDTEVEALKEVAIYIGLKATDVDTLMHLDDQKTQDAIDEWQWIKQN